MKSKISLPLIFLQIIFVYSCDFVEPTCTKLIDGEYEGSLTLIRYFQTDSSYVKYDNCSFSFRNNKYEYEGTNVHVLPNGAGFFQQIGNSKLILSNTSFHTANISFDLVLNGEFSYVQNADSLILSQVASTFHQFRTIHLVRTK